MTHVFHRSLRQDYPMAVRGDGVYVVDAQGKRYLDACGGAAVSCLGHSDRTVIDAVKAQLDRLPYAHTSFFSERLDVPKNLSCTAPRSATRADA